MDKLGRQSNDRGKFGIFMSTDVDYMPSLEQIDDVLQFISIFEQEDFAASEVKAPKGHLPFHASEDDVSRFCDVLQDSGFIYSFDWPSWQDEAIRFYERPEHLVTASLQTIRKLLTLHVRKDRFCEGHFPDMIENGHIMAVLHRLNVVRDAMSSSIDIGPA